MIEQEPSSGWKQIISIIFISNAQHRSFPRFSGICKRIKKLQKINISTDDLATPGIIFYHLRIIYASLFLTKLKSELINVSRPNFLSFQQLVQKTEKFLH